MKKLSTPKPRSSTSTLDAELRTLAGHVACLAGARPEREYQALLARAGLRVVLTEAHDKALARMVDQIDARLRTLGAIGLPGVDMAAAEPYLAAAAGPCTPGSPATACWRPSRVDPGPPVAVTGPRSPRLLTARRGLDRSEWVTTIAAFVISSACYLRWRHPYLARGVVGDLVGLALLSLVASTRRRLRHEAPVCLASIAVVVVIDPEWPLAIADVAWWLAVVVAVAGYLAVRLRVGTGGHQRRGADPPS